MPQVEKDEKRENRIWDEAVVDAYGPEEQAIGWYYYLEEKMRFPYDAHCIRERSISPLQVDETVHVIGMVDANDCMADMFVRIEWAGRSMGVPLAQLQGIDVDGETEEAIADWRYWVDRGNLLCG